MVYSQAKVVAGGLAHIPIVISVFYFIMTTFNKRALKFAEANKLINSSSKVVESKTKAKQLIEVKAEHIKEKVKKKQKDEKKDMKRD